MAISILDSILAPITIAVVFLFIFLFFYQPKYAVYLTFFAKPLIDATWNLTLPFIDMNSLQIMGVAFPLMAILLIAVQRIDIRRYELCLSILAFVFLNIVSFVTFVINRGDGYLVKTVGAFIYQIRFFFQFLNSFAAYFLLPVVVRTTKERQFFFLVLIFAGIFPTVTGLLQILGFLEARTLLTTGELVRISGLYYDSTNLRMYSIQTIVAVIAYRDLTRSSIHGWVSRILLIAMVPFVLVVVYFGYSKAALLILCLWVIVYILLRPRPVVLLCLAIVIPALYMNFSERIEEDIGALFRKEVSFAEGNLPEQNEYTLLGGRLQRWGNLWTQFSDSDIIEKAFGYNYSVGILAHNDFLRILISTGVIGLLVYVIFLVILAYKIVDNEYKYRDPYSMAAILIFISFIVDSIGLVPTVYPGYCWVTFGIISIALNRDTLSNKPAMTHS